MTEAEWLACTDPQPMLEILCGSGKASERKLRLFACACCRRLGNLLSDRYSRKALTVAERYADAAVSQDKLRFAWGDARRAAQVAYRQERQTAKGSAMGAVSLLCEADIGRVMTAVALAAVCEVYPDQTRLADAQREQTILLRDIVGNLYRPVALDPAWRGWQDGTIPKLAQAIYDDRASDHLPILADALEDAGCTNEDILTHCRGPGPHVRGCCALDLLLTKT